MAQFPLRLDEDVYTYAQTQAPKENRSINGFIQNLIQEHQLNNQEAKRNDNNDSNNYKFFLLYTAIEQKKNILISGATGTGKSLLAQSIQDRNDLFGGSSIYLNQKPDVITEEFFQALKEKIDNRQDHVQIIIDDHLSHAIFFEEDSAWLFPKFIELFKSNEKNDLVSFCIVVPVHIDEAQERKLNDLFPTCFVTVRDISEAEQTLLHQTFTLKEVLALKFP